MNRREDCFAGIEMTPTGDDYTAAVRFRDPTTGHEWAEEWAGARITDMAVTEGGDLAWTLSLPIFPDITSTDTFRMVYGPDTDKDNR